MTHPAMTNGSRAVVIYQQGASFTACLFVNARNGLADADITTLRWKGRTLAGARRWAGLQLRVAA